MIILQGLHQLLGTAGRDIRSARMGLHNATEPIRETFVDIPVESVKAANRGTPWGQANQRNYNAAQPALNANDKSTVSMTPPAPKLPPTIMNHPIAPLAPIGGSVDPTSQQIYDHAMESYSHSAGGMKALQALQVIPHGGHMFRANLGVNEDGSGVNLGRLSPHGMNLGVGSSNPQGGFSPRNPQQGYPPLGVLPQGGQFNPGFTPLQGRPIPYNQAPQHPFSIN